MADMEEDNQPKVVIGLSWMKQQWILHAQDEDPIHTITLAFLKAVEESGMQITPPITYEEAREKIVQASEQMLEKERRNHQARWQ